MGATANGDQVSFWGDRIALEGQTDKAPSLSSALDFAPVGMLPGRYRAVSPSPTLWCLIIFCCFWSWLTVDVAHRADHGGAAVGWPGHQGVCFS